MTGPGYLVPSASPVGTPRSTNAGRSMHAVGCYVDSGDVRNRHGLSGFWCSRCAESPASALELALRYADRGARS